MNVFMFIVGLVMVVLGIVMLRFGGWKWIGHILALTAWIPFAVWAVVAGAGKLMPWWWWLLLLIAICMSLLSLLPGLSLLKPVKIIGAILLTVLVLLTLLSTDNLPWQHKANKPAAERTFLDIVGDYDHVWNDQQQVNAGNVPTDNKGCEHDSFETCAKNVGDDLARYKDELSATGKRCNTAPTTVSASFTAQADSDDNVVTFDASASTGLITSYSWKTDDPNNPDAQVTKDPLFRWPYSVPSKESPKGEYFPELVVENRYGCSAHFPDPQQSLKITVPAKATAASAPTSSASPSTPTSSASPSKPSATPAPCATTWPMKVLNHAHYRFVGNGVAAIQHASSDKSARAAAYQWLNLIRTDGGDLRGLSLIVNQSDIASSDMVDGLCASSYAVDTYKRVKLVLDNAIITVGKAPASFYNDGVQQGQFVRAAKPGLRGNLKALKVQPEGGDAFYILARSGNPVIGGTLAAQVGPTDN